jgi:iron complex outermembrane receptor protein
MITSASDRLRRFNCLAMALVTAVSANWLQAQAAPASDAPGTSEVVQLAPVTVTGSRRIDRTVTDSMVPVDLVTSDVLQTSVSSELTDKLMQIVPSYNVQRLTIGEGAAFVRPARMRGLSPDHTLVLVNGKRQHRSALIMGGSSQGVDLAQIPTSAVQRIEVLRDGASAQYGSDAIAGVINVILKDRIGWEGYAQASQYFEGDGFNQQAGADYGVALGHRGFLNVALEYTDAERTSRSVQRADALAYIKAHPDRAASVADPVQQWGQPERENARVMINAEVALTSNIRGYVFGLYGEGNGTDDFNWRNPDTNGAFKTSAYQASLYPDYSLLSLYPGGFAPLFSTEDRDYSIVAGVKGGASHGLGWDLSASTGRNRIRYSMDRSINASFGPDSPTAFDLGGLEQDERNLNADFVYSWENAWSAKPVNIAFGGEHRREAFSIQAGERYSWDVGPLLDLPVGANGFPGWSPNQEVDAHRNSYAGYLDVDIEPMDRLTVGAAGRFEDFSDFGSTANGKLSGRFELTPALAVRAAASTGFHAPTPGLSSYTRTSQGLIAGTSTLYTAGQIAVDNPVAVFLGARPLKPEESTNVNGGLVFNPVPALTVSIDAYQLEVTDRMSSSQSFTITAEQRAQLVASGVTDAASLNYVTFLTNAFDSRTTGVDAVVSYRWKLDRDSSVTMTGAYNYNETQLTRFDTKVLSADARTNLEKRMPRDAGNLSASYQGRRYGVTARLRYYGPWTDAQSNSTIVQEFGNQWLFDLSASYRVSPSIVLSAGAENLFGIYPDEALFNAANGLRYSRNSPYDADGGRWFTRMQVSF